MRARYWARYRVRMARSPRRYLALWALAAAAMLAAATCPDLSGLYALVGLALWTGARGV